MTNEELQYFGRILYGTYWQSEIAKRLKIDRRNLHFWSVGRSKIPNDYANEILDILEERRHILDEASNYYNNYNSAINKATRTFRMNNLPNIKAGDIIYLKLEVDQELLETQDRRKYTVKIEVDKPKLDPNSWIKHVFRLENYLKDIATFPELVKKILKESSAQPTTQDD